MDFKTPGAYIQEIASLPSSIAQVETAIPAFIGHTEKSPEAENTPVRITSMLEYEQFFGGAKPEDITVTVDTVSETTSVSLGTVSDYKMYYAMQLFFSNGGGPCYIVSVGSYSNGITQTRLKSGLTALETEDEPTLIVFPEAVSLTDSNAYSVYKEALDQAEKLQDRFVIVDAKSDDALRNNLSSGTSLKYGAAYYPNLQTTLPYVYDASTISVDVDATGAVVLNTLDLNIEDDLILYNNVLAAVEASSQAVIMPPSSAIAGVYAKVDSLQGVWKAPANVGLNYVAAPVDKLSNEDQESYNVDPNGKSINVIRAFTGKGNIVWGARTLDGNSGEWKYVSVRRFFNMVEESVKKATEAFVFEPNTSNTWVRVRATIENFLNLQWRNGALAGATPEDAYYVRVGLLQTMTSQDVLDGIMNIEIGMAAVRPAEFIVLKFSHKLQEA